MDDLLREFLTETNESLDTVDNQLVRFEQRAPAAFSVCRGWKRLRMPARP